MVEKIKSILNNQGMTKLIPKIDFDLISNPPEGIIKKSELKSDDENSVLILLAIILSTRYHQHGDVLLSLLKNITKSIDKIDNYNLGRFMHIKGYLCWRLNDSIFYAIKYLNYSIFYLNKVDTKEALEYLARVYDTFGQISTVQGFLKDAYQEFTLSLKCKKQVGDRYGESLTLGSLGRNCMELGDFTKAYSFLKKDYEIVKKHFTDKHFILIQLLSHMGKCKLELGEYEAAEEYFNKSTCLAEETNSYVGLAFAYIGLGRLYVKKGETNQSLQAIDKALDFIKKINNKSITIELKGFLHYLKGEILFKDSKIDSATKEYSMAYKNMCKTKTTTPVEMAQLLFDYAKAITIFGDNKKSAQLLQEALKYLDSTSAINLRAKIENELKNKHKDLWIYHSIKRFFGQEKVEVLLSESGRGDFRGKRKDVAILFSDIRGFTKISEKLNPKKLIIFINDYLKHMIRCVDYFGGMVDKIIGDALLAIYSIPNPGLDDPEKAALSALMMREELKRFNRILPQGILKIDIGIGIHYGDVVSGLIGSPLKRSFTVIGDAVNTASRLEEITKQLGCSIIVSKALSKRFSTANRFLLLPLGKYFLKGKSEPLILAGLLGEDDKSPLSFKLKTEIENMTKALHLFSIQYFNRALKIFNDLYENVEDKKRKKVYKLLIDKSNYFIKNKPGPNWKGEIVL